ncbi:MAG TPA: polymer-forming cytoskeletal protein [Gammaproteobacteria bacterium]|nr:polymer-forming cytoskeletal protein [Gammaproteobacteria bacterium]
MKKAHNRSTQITTLIGTGTTVVGDVRFAGGLHLEGCVEGNVEATDNETRLDVSEEGRVKGEIHVGTVVVNGTIEGDIYADNRLVLGTQAHIDGNVYYNVLEMAAGAEVNGKLIHRPANERLALEHQQADTGHKPEAGGEAATGIAADAKQ